MSDPDKIQRSPNRSRALTKAMGVSSSKTKQRFTNKGKTSGRTGGLPKETADAPRSSAKPHNTTRRADRTHSLTRFKP